MAVLDHSALPPQDPDPVRFGNPVCLKLDFKSEELGLINDPQELKHMGSDRQLSLTASFAYYNISIDCKDPLASFTVVNQTRLKNQWAKIPWAIISFGTLGIIPYYSNDEDTFILIENEKEIGKVDYNVKILNSIVMVPKFYHQTITSGRVYRSRVREAHESRILVMLIKSTLDRKAMKSTKTP